MVNVSALVSDVHYHLRQSHAGGRCRFTCFGGLRSFGGLCFVRFGAVHHSASEGPRDRRSTPNECHGDEVSDFAALPSLLFLSRCVFGGLGLTHDTTPSRGSSRPITA